jgi:predicted mannosyl-3-phosphoglycerate phosphatase (HAD superfamily)
MKTVAHRVYYAPGDDGQNVPVLDATNPAFAVSATEQELAELEKRIRRGRYPRLGDAIHRPFSYSVRLRKR